MTTPTETTHVTRDTSPNEALPMREAIPTRGRAWTALFVLLTGGALLIVGCAGTAPEQGDDPTGEAGGTVRDSLRKAGRSPSVQEAPPPDTIRRRKERRAPDDTALRRGGPQAGASREDGRDRVGGDTVRGDTARSNGTQARSDVSRTDTTTGPKPRLERPSAGRSTPVREAPKNARGRPVRRPLPEGSVRVRRSPPPRADTTDGQARIRLQPDQIPPAARDTISALSVSGADLRNLLRGIGEQYGVNLIVNNQIQKTATIRLSNISVLDALLLLCREHNLSLLQSGPVFRIRQPPEPAPTPPKVEYADGRITLNLTDDKLGAVAKALTKVTEKNVIVSDQADGRISGYLQDAPLESGLRSLLENNGYLLGKRDESIYVINKKPPPSENQKRRRGGRSFRINVEGKKVDLNVSNAPVGDILQGVASRTNLNLVTYKSPKGRISANVRDMPVGEVFDLLFRASNVTYRRKDSTYYVGTRKMSSVATTKLVSLDHVKAERVPEMLPSTLKQKVKIKVISEHNGLMLTGANDAIDQLRSAIEAVDKPTPLILIEALVVDFTTTDLFELGLEVGQNAKRSDQAKKKGYTFDDKGFQVEGEDKRLTRYLKELIPLTSNFGIENIGKLPEDFFFQLRALSREGKVDIRSRPQVAALSGHTASIEIGQTQYFILRKETPVRSPEGGAVIQETERFEKIEANVSLKITPWVTPSGEVTTKIRPEFSQPVGEFSADRPPTINRRTLESTVRLKEGETIILGGLIREEENVQYNKIPILGSIPLIGQIFRSRTTNTEKSELVIYLTPHVFYGSENEPERWQELREQKGLRNPRKEPN